MNLETAFEQHLLWMKESRKGQLSIKSYADTFRQYIREGYSYIDDESVKAFLGDTRKESTKAKMIGHFRAFSAWLDRRPSLKEFNLVRDFTLQQRRPAISIPEVVSDEVLTAFLARMKEVSLPVWALCTVIKNTGLRFSEAYNIRQHHLVFPRSGYVCIQFRGKRSNERICVLNKEAQEAFDIWTKQRAFPSESYVRTVWKRVQVEIGVTPFPLGSLGTRRPPLG